MSFSCFQRMKPGDKISFLHSPNEFLELIEWGKTEGNLLYFHYRYSGGSSSYGAVSNNQGYLICKIIKAKKSK